MLKEFKKFIARGNVIDLAVGVIIGTAFGKITTSLVNDLVMPPIGLLLGKVNFNNLYIQLSKKDEDFATLADAKTGGAVTINYGQFISTVLDFLIIAFVIFLVIRQINKLKKPEPTPAPTVPTTKECPECLSEVPIKATRCKYCTSPIDVIKA